MAFYLTSFESIVFYLHAIHFTTALNPYIIPPSQPQICGNEVVCMECGTCLSDKTENSKKEFCHKNYLSVEQANFDKNSGNIFTMDCNSIDMCAVQDLCNSDNSNSCVKRFGSFYCDCKDHFYGQSCSFQNDKVEKSDYATDISIMYAPYSNARDKSIFLVIIGNKGKNLEVHLDYGLGFSIVQNEKSSSYEIPKQVCTDCDIATNRLCNFLEKTEHQTVFYFDTTYPVNIKSDDMLVLSTHKHKEIELGRRYKITVKVINKVDKPNWEPVQFKMIYNKVVWFDVFEGSICVPVVNLKYCAKTDLESYSFPSKDKEIASTVSSHTACKDKIKRRWQFWKFDVNFDENDKPVIDITAKDNETVYQIKKFTMKPSTYIIKLTGIYTNEDKQLSNFAYCFHEIRLEPLEPIISGGITRFMNYKSDLILDAHESKDPNKPPDSQDHLQYYWKSLSDSKIKPFNTSESKYIIKGPFKPNKIYIFNLTLYSADGYIQPVTVHQEIEMSGADVSNLLLICKKNCGTQGYKSNPHEIIFLEVLVEGEPVGKSTEEYVWTYYEIGKARQNVTQIKQHGTPSHVLIIDEEKLKVNSSYMFSVSGKKESKATYIIEISDNPIVGNCSISPLEGVVGETNFTVACDNFKSSQKDNFLNYEFYNKKLNDTGYGLYLGSNQIGKKSEMLLVGEIVLIRITDSIFMYVMVNFTLNLIKKEFSEVEIDQKLTELTYLQKSGDDTGLMGMIAVVAEIANNSVSLRKKILKNSLDAMIQLDGLNLSYIKLVTGGLLNLLNSVEDDVGFDSSSVQFVGYIMRNLANSLKHRMTDNLNLNRQFETSTVNAIAKNMVECSDSVLIRDSDPMITKPVLSMEEKDLVLEYREGFVTMLNSLETMVQSIGHRLMPFQKRFTTNSTSVSVWARKSDNTNEMGDYMSRKDLELNISPELATELGHMAESFIVEVVALKKNPFWWYQGCNNDVQSNIVSVKMRKPNKEFKKSVSHLNNPLDIFLDLTPAAPTPINGTVYQVLPDDDDDTKDLTVSVHRIESDIGAKLFLEFLKPPVPFKVLVLKDMIPDYDYMEELAITVTEENPRYEVKDTIIKSDSFFYVGILPDITATSNNRSQFEYSFNILTVNCKIWRETIFSSKGCEVAQDTTTKKLHCICKHLSIFGGSEFVPPHLINPVEDFKLFLTLKDNPAVFIAVISLLIFYFTFLMWAKYKDNAAEIQRTVVVLEDNFPGEEFGYLVTVYTGARLNSGTNANVGITLFGTNHRSRAHILKSPNRATMQRNNDDWFLLFTPVHLGELCHIHVWHDNKGGRGDWYCEKILVYDLETEEEYVFPLEQWMAPRENEYLEVYMAPIPKTETRTRSNLVFENTLLGFREMHVWLSVINRHPRSSVNRSHRLAVCMSAIMVSMLSSIMYYDLVAHEEDEPFFSINPREIWVTVQSAIIAAPVLYVVLFLFQKSEYKKEVKLIEGNISERRSSVTDVRKTKISNIVVEKKYSVKTQHDVTSERTRVSQQPIENTGKFYNLYSKTVHKVIKTKPLNPVRIPLVTGKQPLKRKKGWLIAAWVTSQSVIFICAFFIIMYGLKLGKVKSELWLLTTAGAVGQDVFLSTPLKIIAISFLLGFAYGRLFEVATYDLNTEDAIHPELIGNKDFIYNLQKLRSQPMYYPLSRAEVLAFRVRRQKFIKWAKFLEFLIILSFSISLIFLVRSMYSAKYFYKNEDIRNKLTEQMSSTILGFNDIKNLRTYINYLSYNFLPKVYQTMFNDIIQKDYDTKFGDTGWFIDETHKLIGVPRVRQIRVKKDKCTMPDLIKRANMSMMCTSYLNRETEEKRNFEFSWVEEKIDNDPTPSPWVYVNADRSETISMAGLSGKLYHGGGYIVNLGRTMKETNFTLSELLYSDWLDDDSQFIIVELTLYSVNSNAFSLVEFIVENLPGGIFLKECQVHSLQVTKNVDFWSITFIVFTAFFLFKNLYTLNQQGLLNYFSQFWNFFEILILILSLTNFAVHVAHIFYSSQKIQDFQMKGKDAFFSYTALLYYYYIIVILLFLLIICCTVRLLRTFKLGRRVIIIYYTISFSIRSVICITIVFILCLLLQSIIVSYRLNEPFINSFKMCFTYKTGYRSILEHSVYPHKRIVVFIFCLSVALFNGVFIVLYSYFYKIAKSHKLLKPELLNYFVLMKEQLEKLFFGACKKRKSPEVYYSTRLRGGMDTITPSLPKLCEKLMLLRIKQLIKCRIIQAENTQGIKKRRLKSDSYKCTTRISEILEFEKNPSEYCKFKISDFDFKLSCIISKIDDILLIENTNNTMV